MKWVVYICLILALGGCASRPDANVRAVQAETLSAKQGWTPIDIAADPFILRGFVPAGRNPISDMGRIRIYIEGDGFAWVDRHTPSRNPTPIRPLALHLALQDNAVYLGRPCQYIAGAGDICGDRKWWTSHRFAPEVIDAYQRAIDQLKSRYQASVVELVGYSGGGVVAVLIAAQRGDVTRVITVAAPLDTGAWVAHHKISPMTGSLNGGDVAEKTAYIRQYHMAGGRDKIVPPHIMQAYASRAGGAYMGGNITLKILPDYTHNCCWAENWPSLLKSASE